MEEDHTMHFDNYWLALQHVRDRGLTTASRLGPARTVLNVSTRVDQAFLPRRASMRRELGYMEGLQFLTGVFSTKEIERVAPKVDLNLFGKSAIYGPRVMTVRDQLKDAIQSIWNLSASRQALVTVTEPYAAPEDQPCISSLQFHELNAVLYTTVNYRSCDVWFGLPHDLITVSLVTQVVARCLSLGLGPLHVNMANAHVYEKHAEVAGGPPVTWWFTVPREYSELDEFRDWARACRRDESWVKGPPPGVSERFPAVPPLRRITIPEELPI